MSLEQDVEVLKRQVKSLRERQKHLDEFMDCLTSPMWKRIVWWFCGFYLRKVGRWYGPITYQPPWPK